MHKLNGADIFPSLRQLERKPDRFFYSGIPISQWSDRPKVAIVGSRKMSAYGAYCTDLFASSLAAAGVVVISGLAYGVDGAAHRAALKAGGITVGVLPTPIDRIYPAAHLSLAKQMESSGGLISEYDASRPVYKSNFTDRNRIIAALCDGLLIPEATLRSGSLHTARYALNLGKTIMAVPGNINSLSSQGCNNLIKSGALAVTEVEDVFAALGLQPQTSRRHAFTGSKLEQAIYNLIAEGVVDQDDIALRLGTDASVLAVALTGLEINGYIRPLGSGRWSI